MHINSCLYMWQLYFGSILFIYVYSYPSCEQTLNIYEVIFMNWLSWNNWKDIPKSRGLYCINKCWFNQYGIFLYANLAEYLKLVRIVKLQKIGSLCEMKTLKRNSDKYDSMILNGILIILQFFGKFIFIIL